MEKKNRNKRGRNASTESDGGSLKFRFEVRNSRSKVTNTTRARVRSVWQRDETAKGDEKIALF